jgi:uncharacterized membrane protein
MRIARFAAASLLLMILHSTLVHADEGPPLPVLVVSSFLQLSGEQTVELMTILQARDAALQPISVKLRADQEALGKLLETSAPDAGAVGRLFIEIRAGEKQASAAAGQAVASFEATLTAEQRARLQVARQAGQVEPILPAFKAIGFL